MLDQPVPDEEWADLVFNALADPTRRDILRRSMDGELSVSAEAHWEGDVHAQSAVVAGRITGCIVVRKKIEIAASAIIRGRVIASSIAIARGATVEGEVTVTGNQPIVEFEEKRAPAGVAQTR